MSSHWEGMGGEGGREGGRGGEGFDMIIVVLLAHTKRLRQVGMV